MLYGHEFTALITNDKKVFIHGVCYLAGAGDNIKVAWARFCLPAKVYPWLITTPSVSGSD